MNIYNPYQIYSWQDKLPDGHSWTHGRYIGDKILHPNYRHCSKCGINLSWTFTGWHWFIFEIIKVLRYGKNRGVALPILRLE